MYAAKECLGGFRHFWMLDCRPDSSYQNVSRSLTANGTR
jgi:hypothetical protein